MKKLFFISMVVSIMLAGCSGQDALPTAILPVTSEPSQTATSTPTKVLQTPAPPTSTITPFPPYPNKQVVFHYYETGNLADDLVFFEPDSCCSITRVVLYDDGQLIIAGEGETYNQKVLSTAEIDLFLSKLETLGFYGLESNQKHDLTDKLYDFGNNNPEFYDGLNHCIVINTNKSRNLCVYEPYIQFLIPKMKNILRYLDEYKPAGATAYYPDRILLTIQAADASVDQPSAIPWKEYFPSLDPSNAGRYISDTSNQVIYVDGEMAKDIYLFLEGAGTQVVSQNGKEYIVYLRVLLPHEKVRNPEQ